MSEILNNLIRNKRQKNDDFGLIKDKQSNVPTVKFDKFIPQTHLGKTPKEWVMCEGWYLRSMYEDLRQHPNNNYVTCMDNLVYDKDFGFDGLDRTKVSCILKKADSGTQYDITSELIASRIANLFGVKSQYVAPVGSAIDKCICVDFLSGQQQMDNYYEFTGTFYLPAFTYERGDSPVRSWVEKLERALKDKLAHLSSDTRQEIISNVLKDFIKQYLFRKYIVRDGDPAGVNYSFVYEKEDMSDLHVSPLYDLQYAFTKDKLRSQFYGLDDDMQYLANMYGVELDQVISEFGSPSFDKVKSIVYTLSPYAYQRDLRLNTVKSGFKELVNSYNAVKASIRKRDGVEETSSSM